MLENEVPSRELCHKWKSVGGRQDTEFSWYKVNEDEWTVYPKRKGFPESDISAPLASEMMEWLPTEVNGNYSLNVEKMNDGEYWVGYYHFETGSNIDEYFVGKLPNALMQMCIERKEEEDGKG